MRARKRGIVYEPVIYGLFDRQDPARVIRYVGYTKQPRPRLRSHRTTRNRCNLELSCWIHTHVGVDMVILERVDYRTRVAAEQRWIATLRWLAEQAGETLLNISDGYYTAKSVR